MISFLVRIRLLVPVASRSVSETRSHSGKCGLICSPAGDIPSGRCDASSQFRRAAIRSQRASVPPRSSLLTVVCRATARRSNSKASNSRVVWQAPPEGASTPRQHASRQPADSACGVRARRLCAGRTRRAGRRGPGQLQPPGGTLSSQYEHTGRKRHRGARGARDRQATGSGSAEITAHCKPRRTLSLRWL
jgi:hypothetical protein